MSKPEIDLLLTALDQAYDRKSWHGTNLRGSLRGMSVETASWRAAPGRHDAWELVVHAAYWKYVVRRRLTGEKRGGFALAGSNFWTRPEPGWEGDERERRWRQDRALLDSEHRALREVVAALDPAGLREPAHGGESSRLDLITGVAAHDLYHAGQIQLLKRLASGSP